MTVDLRLTLGQWYTPPHVADLVLALALPAPRGRQRARVLDPACGDGVFLARALAARVPAASLAGIEVDAAAAASARARLPGVQIHHQDLFQAQPGEFDAVVGNPPYVRQERLDAPTKARMRRALAEDWPALAARDLDAFTGRGDLAAACMMRALRFAAPGARVALVVSSALLDAGYAAPLWRAVAQAGRVVALVEAPEERWFADAAVNAMIVVLERAGEPARPGADPRLGHAREPVRVARLKVPTAVAAARVGSLRELDDVADIRLAPADKPERWAAYLRAPAAWFELEARAGDALVPLGELAEVRRGVTSGANDIFYLTRERAAELGIEPALLMPLLRSPRGNACIAVSPQDSSHMVLVCPADTGALARHPAAQRHIEQQSVHADRPSLRARQPWWALPARPARLFLTKAYAARFVQHLASAPMIADQRVYAVHPRAGVDVSVLAGVLNSVITAFALESLGRASMGEGALEWTVGDAALLPVLDPRRLGAQDTGALLCALEGLHRRPIGTVAQERTRADRAALDQAVCRAVPEVAALVPEIWPALITSVQRRNSRTRKYDMSEPQNGSGLMATEPPRRRPRSYTD